MRANKSAGTFTHTGTGINFEKQQLADELQKPTIRKFKNRKIYSSFKDNIWGTDLADMQLISRYKEIELLLCVADVFSKYAWVSPLITNEIKYGQIKLVNFTID